MKRVYIVIAVLAVALVALIGWQAKQSGEPVYKGRNLTSWLTNGQSTTWTSEHNYGFGAAQHRLADVATAEAVSQVGSKAIPTLLRLLRKRDSALETKVLQLAERLHLRKAKHKLRAEVWNELALLGFELLGTNASSAVPEILQIARENPSASSRLCAIRSLGHIGQPARQAVPFLYQCLTNSDSNVRFCAKYALFEIDFESRLGITLEWATNAVGARRVYAMGELQRYGVPTSTMLPYLIQWAADTNGFVRGIAFYQLSRYGPLAKTAVPFLLSSITNQDAFARAAAISALPRIDPEGAAKASAMILDWAINANGGERVTALEWLTEYVGAEGPPVKQAIPYLRQWATNEDASVREAAITTIPYIDPDDTGISVLPALIQIATTNDSDAMVSRGHAVRALSRLGSLAKPAVPLLLTIATNEDREIGAIVIRALARIDPEATATSAVPAFARAVDAEKDSSSYSDSKIGAARALGEIGYLSKAAVPYLLKWATNKVLSVREAAATALPYIDAEAAATSVPTLIRMLEVDTRAPPPVNTPQSVSAESLFNLPTWPHMEAFKALTQLGPLAKPAIPQLVSLAKSTFMYPEVRAEASRAIMRIDPEAAAKAGITNTP